MHGFHSGTTLTMGFMKTTHSVGKHVSHQGAQYLPVPWKLEYIGMVAMAAYVRWGAAIGLPVCLNVQQTGQDYRERATASDVLR